MSLCKHCVSGEWLQGGAHLVQILTSRIQAFATRVHQRVCYALVKSEGSRLESTSTGTFEEIGGVRCYVATPTVDYPKDKAILYLTDIFGIDLPNHQVRGEDLREAGPRLSRSVSSYWPMTMRRMASRSLCPTSSTTTPRHSTPWTLARNGTSWPG